MDVTVVVATFGSDSWRRLARTRAIPSAQALRVPVVEAHAGTLHDARNEGLAQVDTEFVCHLDADDELEPGYFDSMESSGADLRVPSVRYVTGGRRRGPVRMLSVAGHEHGCTGGCLRWGNWLVVGTVARTSIVRMAGGWRDFDWSEDWDLWVRCWQAGASIEPVPGAVYRAHVRANSRNRAPAREAKLAAHRAIAEANGLPVPA